MQIPRFPQYSVIVAKHLFFIFLIASILIHFGSYVGVLNYSPSSLNHENPVKNREVELVPITEEQRQKLSAPIRFAEAPKELIDDSLDALRKKAEILSEKVQRVKKEMRAKLSGLTQNHQLSKPKAEAKEHHQSEDLKNLLKPTKGIGQYKPKEENASASEELPLDLNPSRFGNHLENDVQVGQFNALNTDRHLFYTFYSRIEEKIRPTWESLVRSELNRITSRGFLRPKNGWSTRLDVILDKDGQLIKVQLLKGSGQPGLDQASIKAFQEANFFPHPPKEMVNEEGHIVLKYLFTIY